jgi:Lon protease-like protein
MADHAPDRLFIFPLGLVLLPGELLPLHIFEERYKRLITHCLDTGDPFGIVWYEDGLAVAGSTARMVAVLEQFEDGRLNIVVRGGERFRLVELHAPDDPELEAIAASVEYFEDVTGRAPAELIEQVDTLFHRGLELMDLEEPAEHREEQPFSFWVADALELELPLRQRLLEQRDEAVRLGLVADSLRTLVERLEVIRSREDAIRGNGKGY